MTKKTVTISKFLSLVLRHKPETIGIELDPNGWVDVELLLAQSALHGREISGELLAQVVETNDKKRFVFSEDGLRIRANQGHSVDIELGLKPKAPPGLLFHGTADRFLAQIMSDGLKKMNRQHVHLSVTSDIATSVGSRHGKPVILAVDCGAMAGEGYEFFLSANGVWLTDHVPVKYLSRYSGT